MAKYKCTICNYIYSPQNGDFVNGILPGTPFKDLPADWLCPKFGYASSTKFRPY